MANPTLEELVNRFWEVHEHAEWKPKTDMIPGDELRKWMYSDDIEILGFISAMIHDHRFRIEPPIHLNDFIAFVKRYYGRCIRENPDGEWSDSRFSACSSFVGIFCWLCDEEQRPTKALEQLKVWLADLYRKGDPDIRYCLETSALEHMFERKAIRKFFSDWKDDPVLLQAYENAELWTKGGGKTPLSKSRKK